MVTPRLTRPPRSPSGRLVRPSIDLANGAGYHDGRARGGASMARMAVGTALAGTELLPCRGPGRAYHGQSPRRGTLEGGTVRGPVLGIAPYASLPRFREAAGRARRQDRRAPTPLQRQRYQHRRRGDAARGQGRPPAAADLCQAHAVAEGAA